MKNSQLVPSLKRERQLKEKGFSHVAGVDEAGRGPLAGPVVVSAVVLPLDWDFDEVPLNDSKKLSEKKRQLFFEIIKEKASAWSIIEVNNKTIDQLNILQATFSGMRKSVESLSIKPDYVLVDGNVNPVKNFRGESIVKGDQISASISAASILAKVHRDKLMQEYHQEFPQFGFNKHKGYPTKLHKEALMKFGASPIHRQSFKLFREQVG